MSHTLSVHVFDVNDLHCADMLRHGATEVRLSCICRIQALVSLGIEAPTLGMSANSMFSYAMGFDCNGPESRR